MAEANALVLENSFCVYREIVEVSDPALKAKTIKILTTTKTTTRIIPERSQRIFITNDLANKISG